MAKSLNRCTFIGNLVRDPEVRYLTDGTAVTKLTIACNDDYKDKSTGEKKEQVEFINMLAFGKLAEICGQYLTKGKQIYAEGKFTTRKYDKDGQTHYTSEIKMDNMQMLGGAGGGAPGGDSQPAARQRPAAAPRQAAQQPSYEDEIPF